MRNVDKESKEKGGKFENREEGKTVGEVGTQIMKPRDEPQWIVAQRPLSSNTILGSVWVVFPGSGSPSHYNGSTKNLSEWILSVRMQT